MPASIISKSTYIQFSRHAPSAVLPFPSKPPEFLQNIQLRILGAQAIETGHRRFPPVPHHVRVFIAGNEVTELVLAKLADLFEERPNSRSQYLASMQHFIDLAEQFGVAQVNFDEERKRATDIHQRPRDRLFNMLGDTRIGPLDHLHVFHHIYCAIPMSPVSLDAYVDEKRSSFDLTTSFLFSVDGYDPYNPTFEFGSRANGGIQIDADFIYRNTNDDAISDIKDRLERLRAKIERRLYQIHKLVGSDGPLRQALLDVKPDIDSVVTDIDEIRQESDYHRAQLDRVRVIADEH